jgi:hypothetical protein
MPDVKPPVAPEFRESSIAAVRLLQGVVYSDETKVWDLMLRWQSSLERDFARLGLQLVVDEAEGFGYLRQMDEDECPAGYEALPKLIRKSRLSYDATVLCVLLREELRRFEEEELHNERCVVEAVMLFDEWKTFFLAQQDEVKLRKEFVTALNKLKDLDFVRKFSDEPEAWEIRRIVKARLPLAALEGLKEQLLAAVRRGISSPGGENDG